MPQAKVDIGIACSPSQSPIWWAGLITAILAEERAGGVKLGRVLTVQSALPDHKKTNIVSQTSIYAPETEKKRNELTDANREKAVKGFLEGDSDWLWFIDDDTVPPPDALTRLLAHAMPFVAGIYYNIRPPYNPIAYIRQPSGLYQTYMGFAKGTFTQVDSVGMGCTLIHRSVFEDIMSGHKLFMRPNGTLAPVHKRNVVNNKPPKEDKPEYVSDGYLHTRLLPLEEGDSRPFPFFVLEYGRTEDHYFCELADSVGYKPWLDTTIVCKHIKPTEIEDEKYIEEFRRMLADGDAYIEPS